MRRYVLDGDGERVGPLSETEVRVLLSDGAISGESAVWSAGIGEWMRLQDVPQLAALLG